MIKRVLTFISAIGFSVLWTPLSAQTYNMSNTTTTTCSGTFYDSGGSGANYADNSSLTQTFTSSLGNCLTFTFTIFLTQGGSDVLTIYDGATTSSPVIGNYSGGVSPGTIVSSTSSLTFEFSSNGSNNKLGWAATISCASCGTSYFLNSNITFNTCDGLFYDSGGSSANYGNNENFTQTFCSSAGTCAEFNFYSLGMAANDTLKIYDGPNTSSTLIAAYTNTTTTPPTLLSSTGCLTFLMKTDGTGTSTGFSAAIQCEPCPSTPGTTADYEQPIFGLGGSYLGGSMIATCEGTYTDDGGISGNYTTFFVTDIYQTFCPAVIDNCLRVQFHSVDLKSGDKLAVRNGPTMDCLPFGTGSTLQNGTCSSYQACMARGWGPFVSNDQSGCITFLFSSNGGTTGAGWVATFDCVPCASGPNGIDNNDCSNVTALCSSTTFSDASTGPGVVSEVDDNNCLVTETYTNWYTFEVTSGGTLGFTINPLSTGSGQPEDYDWALFGPNVSCNSLGNPIRCSSATTQGQNNNTGNMGNTGISSSNNNIYPGYSCASNNDISEEACGNCWVDDLPVTTGETYYLCISKWSAGGSGFDLTWNLTNGASIDCPILPVELTSFECEPHPDMITVSWTSASEINNDYYILERSADGEHYEVLSTVPGKEMSSLPTQYFTIDHSPVQGDNYYRLKQVDKDGTEQVLETTSCTFSLPDDPVLLQVYDLSGKLMFSTNTTLSESQAQLYNMPLPKGVYTIAILYKNGTATLSKYLKAN